MSDEQKQQLARPLMVDTNRLKPIDDKELYGSDCSVCHKPQSRWAFLAVESGPNDDPQPLCSYCFLYESGWGLMRVQDVKEYTADLEKEIGKTFVKDPNGRVTEINECDNMLGAIALFSRMYELRMQQYATAAVKEEQSRIILPGGSQFKLIK